MIHRQSIHRELLPAMVAQTWTNLLAPPLRLSQFAGFGFFALDIIGADRKVKIAH